MIMVKPSQSIDSIFKLFQYCCVFYYNYIIIQCTGMYNIIYSVVCCSLNTVSSLLYLVSFITDICQCSFNNSSYTYHEVYHNYVRITDRSTLYTIINKIGYFEFYKKLVYRLFHLLLIQLTT